MNQVTLNPFPCYSCGKCCANVDLSAETKSLDRGDGICRHLNVEDKQCRIYDTRPDICRVELQYRRHYASTYTWQAFIDINLSICESLPDKLA
ncbi:YkgJ family cysteine cluster protein [Vibrio parahaemolyticus]|uniref:YkgJ family cysteine cluster protein n=3 Tax=Vibrio parahaemolyticus TaxID=670 RepID=UPI000987613E|nr:zinc/iron-chelating domain-containing protein [Vibrio parahaemolyticus]EGQ7679697.1 YkgJ family cysteine cluster protein [Vibrio parahaemolyticus]EGQ7915913.1 YkgJ family cysteine cluster protein [Vibrio parahaemolyticus]EGQ8240963.1 YkgJ family cysteine cluster protein [Vibrio parahaemolyticus]EGQ8298576.1 YkgJ family cysteine cluster protein [Vibrio parahaemolyticus]